MTNKVWLIFLAIFLLLLSSCASEPVPNEQEPSTQTEPVDQIESPSPSLTVVRGRDHCPLEDGMGRGEGHSL